MVKDQAPHHYLADALCEALFVQPGPTRLWVLLQTLPESLPCADSLAREVMGADPRFTPCVTRWDLTHRATVSSRPLGGALEAILQAYGRPLGTSRLVSELCLNRQEDPPHFRELLERLLLSGRDVASFDDCIYLTRWLPNTSVADEQSQLFVNGLADDEEFLALRPKLMAAPLKQRHVLDTADVVLAAAKVPLSNRALGLLLHHHHGERFDAAETLAAMCRDERFLALSGPSWLPMAQEKTLLRGLAKENGGEEPSPPLPFDAAAVLQGPAPVKLKLDEAALRGAVELATAARTPVDLEELLTDLLDTRPRQRSYAAAAHALQATLSSDLALLNFAPGRYLSRKALPVWVKRVPEVLMPETVPLAPREKSLDVLLPLEELPAALAQRVTDPFYEDQGEQDVWPGQDAVAETRLAVLSHHHACGTMKLRLMDRRLYDQAGPVSVVSFITPNGDVLPIWINLETRVLYGFLNWYDEALPPCGALLTVQRDAEEPDRYYLVYEGETDPGTYIGRERLAQLLALRQRLRRRRPFVVEILTSLLQGNEKGLPFDQLWAHLNVIRRTTRLLLASTLTHYGQFQEATAGRWRVV